MRRIYLLKKTNIIDLLKILANTLRLCGFITRGFADKFEIIRAHVIVFSETITFTNFCTNGKWENAQ